MAYQPRSFSPVSAVATATVAALLMAALLFGLRGGPLAIVSDRPLATFAVAPPPPPPPPERTHPHPVLARRSAGKAAPAGLRAKPTDLVLPPPIVPPLLPPPPVQVALTPGPGVAAHAGNSDAPGPGPGAGGMGNGTGSGDDGEGDGSGGDTPPRWRHGELSARDWPRELGIITREYVVGVRYTVDERGRVPDCTIDRSSGIALLDRTTCDLIRQRFRYDPSRTAAGHPVISTVIETHSWEPPRRDDRDQ